MRVIRSSRFEDPTNPARYVVGELFYDAQTKRYTKLRVLFFRGKKDKEPYWYQDYGVSDEKRVGYHRRPLHRGLINKHSRFGDDCLKMPTAIEHINKAR